MSLASGTSLGRYQILTLLGAGGMGEVYRAADTRLGREVAIKVLPEEVASSPDRVRRLQQETQATASLSHPHVIAVYDAGIEGRTPYVVFELLEGRDLRDVIDAGALPPRRVLAHATEIASGLAAVHGQGIVHRDLKPENVFVTRDGRVKILDFGIARLLDEATPVAGQTTLTAPGTMIGTVGYMAPEQVRGNAVDHRSDVFAFGAVLYEMLTGRRAFTRDTVPETLSAILRDDPQPWPGDGTVLTTRLMRLARRCLEKDPDARFQSTRDLMSVLSDEALDTSSHGPALAPRASRTRPAIALAFAGLACLMMGAASAVMWRGQAAVSVLRGESPATVKLWLPPAEQWGTAASGVPRLSRDGRRVAAVLIRQGVARTHVLDLATGSWREVPGTERSTLGFFSPDGSQLTYVHDGALMRVGVDGSGAIKICDCGAAARGGDWAEDGRVVLGMLGSGLVVVASTGGTPMPATTVNRAAGEADHRYPVWLPDGRSVLFTVTDAQTNTIGVGAATIGSATHAIVVPGGRNPTFIAGHLVYTNDANELRAVRFDPATLTADSPSLVLPEQPGGGERIGDVAFRVSSDSVVYVPYVKRLRHFELVDRRGSRRRLPLSPLEIGDFSVSPNGERLVLSIVSGQGAADIWQYDIPRDSLTQVTMDRNSRYPIWVDDQRLLFERRGIPSKMVAVALDAGGRPAGPPQVREGIEGIPMFLDGDMLVYAEPNGDSDDMFSAPLSAMSRGQRLLERPQRQWGAKLSADRSWLAYVSDELARDTFDVFLSPYQPPLRPHRLVTGARGVRWSRTSNELFFIRDSKLFVGRIGPAGSWIGEPTLIAEAMAGFEPGVPLYDTLPDGRLLRVVDEPVPADAQAPVLILNWATRLREPDQRP